MDDGRLLSRVDDGSSVLDLGGRGASVGAASNCGGGSWVGVVSSMVRLSGGRVEEEAAGNQQQWATHLELN